MPAALEATNESKDNGKDVGDLNQNTENPGDISGFWVSVVQDLRMHSSRLRWSAETELRNSEGSDAVISDIEEANCAQVCVAAVDP